MLKAHPIPNCTHTAQLPPSNRNRNQVVSPPNKSHKLFAAPTPGELVKTVRSRAYNINAEKPEERPLGGWITFREIWGDMGWLGTNRELL
jgi:hypothetical protein